jgi:hypothetical protein
LGGNNVVSVVNKSTLLTNALLLNYTYTFTSSGSLIVPDLIQDFDVDSKESFLVITQSSKTKILNLMNFVMKTYSSTPFYKILFNNFILTGITHTISALSDQFYQSSVSILPALSSLLSFRITAYSIPNVKNCQCSESPDNNFLVYWDQYSNVYVFNYTDKSTSPVYIGKIASSISKINLTQTIAFSSDSQYFIIEADSQLLVRIVSLNITSLLSIQSFIFNGVINKAMFLDSGNIYIILFNDTAVTII